VRGGSLDIAGAALWATAVVSLILPLNLLRGGALDPVHLLLVYSGTLLTLVAFVVWELRQAEPVVQVRLFTSPTFRAAALSESLMNFSFFPITVVLAIFIQTVQGNSATLAGVVLAAGSVAMVVFSPAGGWLADRFGRRRPAVVGRVIAVLGLAPLLAMSEDTSPILLTLWLTVMSIGGGLSWAAVQSAAVEAAPRRYSGMATGVFTTSANLGGILGITWSSVYLGDEPGLRAFHLVFIVFVATALAATAVSIRIRPWPTSGDEPDVSPSVAPASR
jgi:MFS family permease